MGKVGVSVNNVKKMTGAYFAGFIRQITRKLSDKVITEQVIYSSRMATYLRIPRLLH